MAEPIGSPHSRPASALETNGHNLRSQNPVEETASHVAFEVFSTTRSSSPSSPPLNLLSPPLSTTSTYHTPLQTGDARFAEFARANGETKSHLLIQELERAFSSDEEGFDIHLDDNTKKELIQTLLQNDRDLSPAGPPQILLDSNGNVLGDLWRGLLNIQGHMFGLWY